MGNGYAISAVAGKKEIMKQIEEGVFISTTFGGDSVPMAASLATLKILERPGFYDHIWKMGTLMQNGLKELIKKYQLENVLSVSGLAPHGGIAFEGSGKLSYLDVQSAYSDIMINEGILVFAICNLNMHHTEKEIQAYLAASDKALANVKKAVEKDSLEGLVNGKTVNPVFKRNIK